MSEASNRRRPSGSTAPGLFVMLLGAAVFLAAAAPAAGQRLAAGVRAGVVIPHGDLAEGQSSGPAINAALEYAVTDMVALELIGGYRSFRGSEGAADLSVLRFSGNAKLHLGAGATRPFLNGGGGVYFFDPGDTEIGGNVGAGLLFALTPRFGVEVSYNLYAASLGESTATFSTVEGGIRVRL
jgi:hypothetical protein